MDLDTTLAFLAERAIPGVEAHEPGTFTRVLRAAGGPGRVRVWLRVPTR